MKNKLGKNCRRVNIADIRPGMLLLHTRFGYDTQHLLIEKVGLVLGELPLHPNGERPSSGVVLFLVLTSPTLLETWDYCYEGIAPWQVVTGAHT